ncbi:DUF3168 domain-containing protein [uncultured Roseovarius sp.]|uniref:DUF3168 domain-containing protein n=1 Tax=uncultured Roseovarius sp. TaxID=293344 RepID=UPI002604E1BD|nr:DUF3168 domain-containing protein [uncultured Roseovarius sp.]
MSVDLAVQIAIRTRLVTTQTVTDLVAATSILDRNKRPAPSPSIILGDVQVLDEGNSLARSRSRVYHTIHVWKVEPSREGVKAISGAIRTAIHSARLDLGPDFHCVDWRVSSMRALNDPDGETSHGIVTVDVLAEEVAS